MSPASQLMLYRCMWLAEKMMRPTIRVALTSFDDWAAKDGLWREIRRLEAENLVEMETGSGHRLDRVIRLTEEGRKFALGGVLPPDLWNRGWDGRWRLVFFDVPEKARGTRGRLRAWLAGARFGALQKSVWITPDPLDNLAAPLRKEVEDCGVLTAFEGHPCFGESPEAIVRTSWNFDAVADAYQKWRLHADGLDKVAKSKGTGSLVKWGDQERVLWADCMRIDPLLPRELWPAAYSGEASWKLRMDLLSRAARLLGNSL